MTEKCSDVGCDANATWIRCTQFAGKHYYCEIHAKAEKDFNRGDDSCYWITTYDYNIRMAEKDKLKKPKIEISKEWCENAAKVEMEIPDCNPFACSPELISQSRPKQVLVVRRDLHMRKGKEYAQLCHASISFLVKHINGEIQLTLEDKQWLEGSFTKICLVVNSEVELLDIHEKAKQSGLRSILITDKGLTEFNNVPTHTCIAIGPDIGRKIDPITKHLRLY